MGPARSRSIQPMRSLLLGARTMPLGNPSATVMPSPGASGVDKVQVATPSAFSAVVALPREPVGPVYASKRRSSAGTAWGKVRATMGHPSPFNLKLLGIGNENWGPKYLERLAVFQKAIKEKYPAIKLITSSGTDPDGDRFNLLDNALRKMEVDFIDEHFYRRPEWFLQNASRYDQYPRTGTKIFAGEWAAQSEKTGSANNKNNWLTALSEAAFMTGMERNADVVQMASYAPLFAHTDAWQWSPDLVWVNNLVAYGTPDYYVQKLFATNRGSNVVPISKNNEIIAGKDSLYASAAFDNAAKELIIKLVNVSHAAKQERINLEGISKINSLCRQIILTAMQDGSMNSFDEPFLVAPKESSFKIKNKQFDYTLPARSLVILRIKLK